MEILVGVSSPEIKEDVPTAIALIVSVIVYISKVETSSVTL